MRFQEQKFAKEENIEHYQEYQTFPTVSKYQEILILNGSVGGESQSHFSDNFFLNIYKYYIHLKTYSRNLCTVCTL